MKGWFQNVTNGGKYTLPERSNWPGLSAEPSLFIVLSTVYEYSGRMRRDLTERAYKTSSYSVQKKRKYTKDVCDVISRDIAYWGYGPGPPDGVVLRFRPNQPERYQSSHPWA